MLHGLPDFWLGWRRQIAALSPDHLVLAPDLRGLNLSDRPIDLHAYAMAHLIGDALAVLDAAGVQRAAIVGHDWGGMIGWWLATFHPERVARLAVISAPHPLDYLAAVARRPETIGYVRRVTGDEPWSETIGMLTGWATDAYGDRLRAVLTDSGRAPVASYYRANLAHPAGPPGATPKIAAPTLAIFGDADPVVPAEAYAGLAGRLSVAPTVLSLQDCGHFPQHSHAGAVTAALRDFLK